jgi:TetR/AcrR family fatty acid metabolism transcriptional regulator
MPRLTARDRRLHGAERRKQILLAAARVFADRGYAAATIEDIARAAHVAEGTIYNYFRSKEALLIHIPRYLAGPVLERLAALPDVESAEAAERALIAMGEGMVHLLSTNIRFVKVFLSALPYLSRRAREEYMRRLPMAAAGVLEAHLRRGMARGIYRRDVDPAVAGRALPGTIFMITLLQQVLLGRRMTAASYGPFVRETVSLFLHGALEQRAPV